MCGESSQVALTQAVSFRAEIQSPKTLIYPVSIKLGEVCLLLRLYSFYSYCIYIIIVIIVIIDFNVDDV